jgi:hypothetical protein
MPPKLAKAAAAADGADGRKQPTAQEAYLFYTIIKNMKGKPEIDWAAVATDAGFKNAETAKVSCPQSSSSCITVSPIHHAIPFPKLRSSYRISLQPNRFSFRRSDANILPPKVRYGQIKRKLGLDNWNVGKPKDKDEDTGDNGAPETPAAARTKKAAATPSTGGTGAGVKKRGSTGKRATNTSGSRSRKSKAQALVKMEEGIDQAQHLDDDEDMLALESPTKNPVNRIKPKFGAVGHNTLNYSNEYATFPSVLPDAVLERHAILVNVSGNWTLSPVPIEIHAQWLARLPAHIQTRFYTQAAAGNNNNNNLGGHQTSGGDGSEFLVDDNDANNDAAAVNAQLLGEHFNGLPGMSNMGAMSMSMAGVDMGYLSAVGVGHHDNGNGAAGGGNSGGDHGNNGNQVTIDLHSIPMHPSYMAQLDREAREQEARDQAALFGDHGGY